MSSSIKPILGSQLEYGHPSAAGLVGLWLFNEGSGNIVNDLSGGNTGTLTGGDVVWVSGKFGSGLNFPGSSGDYVDCGTGLGGILGSANKNISVSIWFKADITGSNDGLFYLGDFASSQGKFHTVIFANDLIVFINGFSEGDIAFTDTTSWHHYVATYNGIRVKLYLDNILKVNRAYSTAIDFTGAKTIIGAYYSSSLTFNGLIDHAMIYNRALSASEIALLYREPFVMFERNPIELWVGATSVGVAPSANPKGPLGHPLHGALAGPVSF